MKYKIESILPLGSIQGNYGKLNKYAVKFVGQKNSAEMLMKPDSKVPVVGDSLEGDFISDSKWGLKFKRALSGGFQGQRNDPERQSSIEWQSARRDAVDYCIAKSRLLFDLKKIKEAEEELSGKHIFEVALYFKGIETGATQLKDKKEVPVETDQQSEQTDEDFSDEEVEKLVEKL